MLSIKSVAAGLFMAVAVVGMTATSALAGPLNFNFTKIADSNTPIPGGGGTFSVTGLERPAIDGGEVVFFGSGSSQQGIYSTVGGSLGAAADFNTAIPGGTGSFTNFGLVSSISGGEVAFVGSSFSPLQHGIYSTVGGLHAVADTSTLIPGGSGASFGDFGFPSINGGEVAFAGNSLSVSGIYSTVGGLHAVADTGTAIPGGTGNFAQLVNPQIDGGGEVVFHATGNSLQQGIYSTAGGLHAVADKNTAIPGGTGKFTLFQGVPSIDGGEVFFFGRGNFGQNGIYSTAGGLHAVADTGTAIPGGVGNFTFFSEPAVDGSDVAFTGFDSSFQAGLYLIAGGLLQEIISVNDTLDSKALSFLSIFRGGLSGNSITFLANFSDGSLGVYSAAAVSPVSAVPEPTTLAIFGLGLAGLVFMRRRRFKT